MMLQRLWVVKMAFRGKLGCSATFPPISSLANSFPRLATCVPGGRGGKIVYEECWALMMQRHISPYQQLHQLFSQTGFPCFWVVKVRKLKRKAGAFMMQRHIPLSAARLTTFPDLRPVFHVVEVVKSCSATFPPMSSSANYFPRLFAPYASGQSKW